MAFKNAQLQRLRRRRQERINECRDYLKEQMESKKRRTLFLNEKGSFIHKSDLAAWETEIPFHADAAQRRDNWLRENLPPQAKRHLTLLEKEIAALDKEIAALVSSKEEYD